MAETLSLGFGSLVRLLRMRSEAISPAHRAPLLARAGLPGRVEHFIAYAGSAAIAMAGYGATRGATQIICGFWVYAGVLEYLQHFSPGRHPAIGDFGASTFGALCGDLVIALVRRRLSG